MQAALEQRDEQTKKHVIETMQAFVEEKTDKVTSLVQEKAKETEEITSGVRVKLEERADLSDGTIVETLRKFVEDRTDRLTTFVKEK